MKEKQAPASVVTLGTLNIVFGALFSFCCAASFVRLAAGYLLFLGPRFEQEALQRFLEDEIASHQLIEWVGAFGGVLVFALMFVSGIGLVSRRNWGRTTALVGGVLLLAYGVGMIIYNIGVEAPAMARFLRQQPRPGNFFSAEMIWALHVAMALVLTLIVVFAFVTLVLLLRKHVRQHFSGASFDVERFEDDDWDDDEGPDRPRRRRP